jgi:ribosomal protein L3 glutamine methyltransferase
MFAEAASHLLTVRDCLRFAVSRFNEAQLFFGHGNADAYDEAAYLILHALHLPLDRLEPFLDARLTPDEIAVIGSLLSRRIKDRVPAAYLTREAWLGEYRFYVDERVIVPRSPVAHMLLDDTLTPWIEDFSSVKHVLDLCTGSGCLAILAAHVFPEAQVDATELSSEAIDVARRNIDDHGVSDRVNLRKGDLFSDLKARYDLILANPPYVNLESMQTLPAEYRAEPALALAGGADGLDIVRRILSEAPARLKPEGCLVVEVGHNRDALEAACPDIAFIWLETGPQAGHVFLLKASELPR